MNQALRYFTANTYICMSWLVETLSSVEVPLSLTENNTDQCILIIHPI